MIEIKIIGEWNKFKNIVSNLANNLEESIFEGMYDAGLEIQDEWRRISIDSGLPEEYYNSIDIIPRRDSIYIGPTYMVGITDKKEMKKVDEIQEGDMIVFRGKCPVNKYYEVKKKIKRIKEQIERFKMPNIIQENIDTFKEIIRKNIKENVLSLIKG
jgi:hypothetical protein